MKEQKLVLQLHLIRDPECAGEPGSGEKLLLKNPWITAGSDPINELVIPGPLKRFTLLKKRRSGGGYELFIPKEMTGTISHPDQTESVSIDSLRKLNLLPQKDQGHILFLPVGSKAELVYGSVRLNLEYVPEPPPPPRPIKEKQPRPGSDLKKGFLEADQKGFWAMFLVSLCLHLLFIGYVYRAPLPSSDQEHPVISEIPERFVRLIISPGETEAEKKLRGIQPPKSSSQETKPLLKPATEGPQVQKPQPPPTKEAKLEDKQQQMAKGEQPKEGKQGKKESKPPSESGELGNKAPSSAKSKPSLVAKVEEGSIAKGEPSGREEAPIQGEGKSLASLSEKKIDPKSLGILGMISSRKASQSESGPAFDSQLNLLAQNAINGGETLVKQIEKATPPPQALSSEELNDELPLESTASSGEEGAGGGSGAGEKGAQGEKKAQQTEKSGAKTLAKKVDELVAMHQQTDTVELPVKGDIALQKIAEIKTSGSQNQLRSPQAILEVVTSYRSSIVHCYNKALKIYPRLEGRLVVEFTITAQGDISEAKVVSSTLSRADSGLEECVLSMIRSWRFAPIPLGTTTVIYPFVFFPAL